MKKIVSKIAYGVCVALVLWMGASFIDVVTDNTTGEAIHSDYNAFVLLWGTEN